MMSELPACVMIFKGNGLPGWGANRTGRTWMGWCGLVLLGVLQVVAADPVVPAAVPERTGREIYETCLLCHSTREMQRGPILDGLPDWYVAHQLRKFKKGIRGGVPENRAAALMVPVMDTLKNDEEIQRVADYIAELPPQPHLLVIRGDKKLGKTIYTRCIPCHGLSAEGNRAVKAPPLSLLEDWYLLDQLRKFQRGWRGTHAEDMEGRLMGLGVKVMPVKDLRDVVRYIAEDLPEVPPLQPKQPPHPSPSQ